MPHSRFALAIGSVLAFVAGYATHAFSRSADEPRPLPPASRAGWPELDSARVVRLARAAYHSEFMGGGELAVDSLRRNRLGYRVALSPVPLSVGGSARVRVSNAGGACVLDVQQ